MKFLDLATNVRATKGSDRVLKCESTGEEYPIATIAKAFADKFDKNVRTVTIQLNNAARNGKSAFGLTWSLASGTPYGAVKPRGPRKVKTNVAPIGKKKAG